MKCRQYLGLGVFAFAAIIHLTSENQKFSDPFQVQVSAPRHQIRHPLEDREVSLLLRGEESKPVKEGNDVIAEGVEVIDLEEPDIIRLVSNGAAVQVMLEECQNGSVFLGDIQAKRNFPRELVVISLAEAEIEASLAIHEAGKVIPERWVDLRYV